MEQGKVFRVKIPNHMSPYPHFSSSKSIGIIFSHLCLTNYEAPHHSSSLFSGILDLRLFYKCKAGNVAVLSAHAVHPSACGCK